MMSRMRKLRKREKNNECTTIFSFQAWKKEHETKRRVQASAGGNDTDE
jgi:hypothetical protein